MDASSVQAFFDDVASDWDTMRLSTTTSGFTEAQVEGFFGDARLSHYGYGPLGMQ